MPYLPYQVHRSRASFKDCARKGSIVSQVFCASSFLLEEVLHRLQGRLTADSFCSDAINRITQTQRKRKSLSFFDARNTWHPVRRARVSWRGWLLPKWPSPGEYDTRVESATKACGNSGACFRRANLVTAVFCLCTKVVIYCLLEESQAGRQTSRYIPSLSEVNVYTPHQKENLFKDTLSFLNKQRKWKCQTSMQYHHHIYLGTA